MRGALIINSKADRERAARWAWDAPWGTRVEYKHARRSLPQNSKLWASLSELSRQLPWHGLKLSANDWKLIMLDALNHEIRMVPNVAGTGFVNLGRSSSNLTKDEMSQLLELIVSFGVQHGVVFHDGQAPPVGERVAS